MLLKIETNTSTSKEPKEPKTKDKKQKKMATQFSKKLVVLLLVTSSIVSLGVLILCYFCIINDYQGNLPFLTSLIGIQELGVGFICKKYLDKSQSENTKGGIIYDLAMTQSHQCNQDLTDHQYEQNNTYEQGGTDHEVY